MSDTMFTCLDTVIRMIVCREDDDACWSRCAAPSGGNRLSLKDVPATAINKRYVYFKCPLNSQLCINHHVVAIPESIHAAAGSLTAPTKVDHVIDTNVIIGCLDRALHRGAFDELLSFVSAGTFRALRIVVTPETIVDDDDNPSEDHGVHTDLDQKAKALVATLIMKGKDHVLSSKVPASVRRAVERHRAKATQEAHIALAVRCQMFNYQRSLVQRSPYA